MKTPTSRTHSVSKREPAEKMLPSEQAAYDFYATVPPPDPAGLMASEPVLQSPSPDSMAVVFAVNGLSTGFADVSRSPDMKDAVRFQSEGFPRVFPETRVLSVRMRGLRPGTRYWYRVGATRLVHPWGWTKKGAPAVGAVHSFTTPGPGAPSGFAAMSDTHGAFPQMARLTAKCRECGAPFLVWNGDASPNSVDDFETLVKTFLAVPENDGYAADTPILFNPGNHDYRGDLAHLIDRVVMTPPPRRGAPAGPGLERNFAVRAGEIALIGLDTGEDKPDDHPANGGISDFSRHRRIQAEWLEDVLSSRDIAEAPFATAFVHIPIFDPDPLANPGTTLVNYAHWQKECAELWGPVLSRHGVQLVVAGHMHRFRFDPARRNRTWAQVVCGGPGKDSFQTFVCGEVRNGSLVLRVHDTDADRQVLERRFGPREVR